MDAVREIDLQPALSVRPVVDHFVNRGGTESLTGVAVFFRASLGANVRVEDVEMNRLIELQMEGSVG